MSLHLANRWSAALGRLPVSASAAVAIVLSCGALGVMIGILIPLRSIQPAAPTTHGARPLAAPSEGIEISATSVLPVAKPASTTPESQSAAMPVPNSTMLQKQQRVVGAPPIETDHPCRWSRSADGILTCAGRQVMRPGAGNALHVRQCSMMFHDKVRFSGIEMHVVSKQVRGNPFLVRSPDDWKMNFDAPNATTVRVIFTADTPEPGNVVCQFSYHLQKVP
jgi:hypothetical protein